MKKIFILLTFICLFLGAIGAAYYLGVFDKEIPALVKQIEQSEAKPVAREQGSESAANQAILELPEIQQKPTVEAYYVNQATTAIKVNPDPQAADDGIAYYGEKLTPQSTEGGWVRIAPIYQLEPESEEVSQWVSLSDLSEEKVPLAGDKWTQILDAYLNQSDDYAVYSEEFLQASTQLLQRGECRLADFEQVGGWVKSINYPQNVYFTYCGGIDAQHKRYLNVVSQLIF